MCGRAGVGKSSLLAAAVIPNLEQDKLNVLAPGRLSAGWSYPRAALPPHNPYTVSLLSSWSPAETANSLADVTVGQFISRHSERHDSTIFVVIDQAEELFASTEPRRRAHSRQFLRELAEALRESPRLHLLLSMREPAVEPFAAELGSGALYRLRSFDRNRALDAVAQPVIQSKRSFAPGAAEKLVADMMTSRIESPDGQTRAGELDRVEPALLQVACAHLWESLPAHVSVVSDRDIRVYGDVDTALAEYCGLVIAAVAADHDIPAPRLRSWLLRTFVTEIGTRGTAYEGIADTAGMPNTVPRALEDQHLLTSARESGAIWYRLLSDRLIEPLRHAADTRPPVLDADDYLRAAGRALALGEFVLAQRYCEDALHTLPEADLRRRAQAHSLLGNLAFELDRPAEAEKSYRVAAGLCEAVRDTAGVATQLAAVGQTLLAQGRLAEAVEELRAASDRVPNDLTVQTELGLALWTMGKRRAAVDVLTGVLAIDGGDSEALRVRGEILADLGDARDALRDLDRVLWRERPSTRAARGLARAELGEPGADKEIDEAIEDAPRNGSVLLYAARAKALAGDKTAAMRLARHALNATDPALPQHQREAALAMVGQNHVDHR